MANLLATRRGRLLAFFLLYATEGIPQGFTSVAVAYQMRRRGLGPAAVGAFVATLYLPWAWKVLAGPVVDLVYSDRLGRRRGWIVGCQLMMAATLLAAWPVDFAANLGLFTAVILIHNVFAATQDVAIDALAVTVLPPAERGTANGLMFAGAYAGAAVGGAGVLYLTPVVGFGRTFWMVAAAILAVTATVSWRLREPGRGGAAGPGLREPSGSAPRSTPPILDDGTASIPSARRAYLRTLLRSLFGTRAGLAGAAFALLPTGAYAVSLAAGQNLPVEFGLSEANNAHLSLAGTVLSAAGCVAGGFLSDRLGRRRAIAAFVLLTTVPTLLLAWQLHRYGWVMPADTAAAADTPARPAAPPGLVAAFVWASLAYALVLGLIYGSRTAGFMDLSHPAVAGTQFTAYMAMMNVALAYSSKWQGRAAESIGYPALLTIDAVLGLACLVPLALMRPRAGGAAIR